MGCCCGDKKKEEVKKTSCCQDKNPLDLENEVPLINPDIEEEASEVLGTAIKNYIKDEKSEKKGGCCSGK